MEDYKKKYKEALNNFKKIKAANNNNKELVDFIEYEYPELKESEDERIRKILIEQMERWHECALENNVVQDIKDSADAIAWLEKQGNKLHEEKVDEAMREIEEKAKAFSDKHKGESSDEILAQMRGEQKPIDKVEPEPYFYCKYGGTIPLCSDCKRNHINSPFKTEEITTWYVPSKSTKRCIDYIVWPENQDKQKPAWSGEDNDNIMLIEDRLSDYLDYIRGDFTLTKHQKNSLKERVIGYVNWLKSLKERYSWKPSEEQIEAVRIAAEIGTANNSWAMDVLKSMYQDLKKLKGE